MREPEHIQPPRWPLKLLRRLLRPEYLEEIEGDMEELFQDNLSRYAPRKAQNLYLWDSLRLLRPSLLNPLRLFRNHYRPLMFKNHLLIALRVFRRDKVYTLINLIGMSLGLAMALLILFYVRVELTYEHQNPLSDQLVRITMDYLDGETVVDQDCETYPPLGPLVEAEIPEVEAFVRTYQIEGKTIKVGEDVFRQEGIYAVDPTFFAMFNYPLLHGSSEGLFVAPHEVVLTESTAKKYFNRTNVVGEEIYWPSLEKSFLIKGVIKDSPLNTHLKVQLLFSFASMKASFGEKDDNWGGNNTYTYLQLTNPEAYQGLEIRLKELTEKLIREEKIENERVVAQPIRDIHLYSNKSFEPDENGDATSVFFLLGVAILVIIIAIVNYINLSTSKSLDRAKEVGIRKVLGSSLSQLRSQFFTEAFLINVAAGALAIILISIALPAFRQMAGLPDSFQVRNEPLFWAALIGLVGLSTLLSGLFPAFILSAFKPIAVLKGELGQGTRGILLRKGLVIFQFAITIFLLTQTLTASLQLQHMRQIDLGVDIEQTVVVRMPDEKLIETSYQPFKSQLLAYPQMEAAALSTCVPGLPSYEMGTTTGINLTGATEKHSYNFYIYFMDADFVPTTRMTLLAGENFLPGSENKRQVIVNEEAIRLWGISSPEEAIGKQIDQWGEARTIKGVIKNFHQSGGKSDFVPMILMFSETMGNLASIRTQPGDTRAQLAQIKEVFLAHFSNQPFEYFFMDQEYNKQYQADERFQQVFSSLTAFAILIACFGLFGLVSFAVSKRAKEIGIRKVLGANVPQLMALLAKSFLSLILLASLISIPITYWVVENWLERYPFRIDLEIWLFVLPAALVVLISWLTIFSQTLQISTRNPIESLRDE